MSRLTGGCVMPLDTSMMLPDGRTLAYTDCGAPDGPVALYFHGAPTSRLDLVPLEGVFRASVVRVISPDRPGYGRSSPQPGRGFLDRPRDVATLADHLDVDRFVVVGLSSGGPYAVACAAVLQGRVSGVGVVDGVTDMGWPQAWDDFDPVDAALIRLGDEAAIAVWCEQHYGRDGSHFLDYVSDATPPTDLALMEDQAHAEHFIATIAEAFHQGVGGLPVDLAVQGRPWSFNPADITAPTTVLHGEADNLVLLAHGRHTADVIPGARFAPMPGHGHISLISEIPRLCAGLLAASKEVRT